MKTADKQVVSSLFIESPKIRLELACPGLFLQIAGSKEAGRTVIKEISEV